MYPYFYVTYYYNDLLDNINIYFIFVYMKKSMINIINYINSHTLIYRKFYLLFYHKPH